MKTAKTPVRSLLSIITRDERRSRESRSTLSLSAVKFLPLVFLLSNCAAPPPPEKELGNRTFSSIAIISPSDILSVSASDPRSDKMKESIGTGAASGSLGGMLIGAAACGPYLYGLCVIGIGTAGFITGGAGGAIFGFSGISGSTAEDLTNMVEDINLANDLQTELVNNVIQQVDVAMLSNPETAEIQVVITIEKLEFAKAQRKVHLQSTVRASFESTESRRVPEYGSRVFKGRSSEYNLDNLLESDTGAVRDAVKESLQNVVDEIVLVLNAHWNLATDKKVSAN